MSVFQVGSGFLGKNFRHRTSFSGRCAVWRSKATTPLEKIWTIWWATEGITRGWTRLPDWKRPDRVRSRRRMKVSISEQLHFIQTVPYRCRFLFCLLMYLHPSVLVESVPGVCSDCIPWVYRVVVPRPRDMWPCTGMNVKADFRIQPSSINMNQTLKKCVKMRDSATLVLSLFHYFSWKLLMWTWDEFCYL